MNAYEVRLFDKSGALTLTLCVASATDDGALLQIRELAPRFATIQLWRERDLIYFGPFEGTQAHAA